ncbi:putative oligopeptide transporter, OPT family [Granulicella pectinivorans]|jgi:putative OPT family oligopeptide transporter|uniref:Putative oligopeptide transporter, OPT family n=1 Tax=Granulicella pectinivorans TaxID=474950 RepID=A0A1I6LWH0_9BACT|nr:oligopeptide transporter, OPT family [Granulicella pectinivorans]SFS07776.1 putative oligopeptide transporter, OPT family [Granulicella pectinivorans]
MAASKSFQPFVPASESRAEFTPRAVILGAIFAVLFGAVTVYVGLRAGLTVAASIPISVLSITILRAFGKASILENNIVQTVGNAGQSIASGVIFTLPALIFLGFDLESTRIFALALFGGWLGVLFMIPLRRQLIVDEHETLLYPEGTACADVLMAGERGGSFASRVFWGLGMGGLYALFQNEYLLRLWPSGPNYEPDFGPQHLLKGAAIRADCTPEYLGVGYIIGIRVAAVMLAGGCFSWLVLMPAISFFGGHLTVPLYPGTIPIGQMDPSTLWKTYVRPMGAGAVAAAGLITLLRTAPTIVSALMEGIRSMKAKSPAASRSTRTIRTAHDLPMSAVLIGSVLLIVLMVAFLQFHPVPGAQVGLFANISAALLVVVFGFLFVAVSARIVGIVGSSSSPVSGMTIATLMATTAIFLVRGWTAPAFGALAITIGGIVCIAASNAGDTAQDLKTGYLIGATPWKQQVAVMVGVIISVVSIGATLSAMNNGLETFQRLPTPIAVTSSMYADGVQDKGPYSHKPFHLSSKSGAADNGDVVADPHAYTLLNVIGSSTLPDGKYLLNPTTGKIEIQWIQGIGSEQVAAPQGRLMATVINGILSRKLPWGLVLLGVALVIVVELLGVRSLTFAVGAYLSIATTLAIFVGGVMRWMIDRAILHHHAKQTAAENKLSAELWQSDRTAWMAAHPGFDPADPAILDPNAPVPLDLTAREIEVDSEISPGSLYASGLIAAGGLFGLLGVCLKFYENYFDKTVPRFPASFSAHSIAHDWLSILMFGLLAFSLYYFARKPLDME